MSKVTSGLITFITSVSAVRLYRHSCQAELLAQMAKDGQQNARHTLLVGHLPIVFRNFSARNTTESQQCTARLLSELIMLRDETLQLTNPMFSKVDIQEMIKSVCDF